ncbi:MAG: WD40 repeat domain-containing protein [Nitrospira sp.]|nr:WD40 repeat domain-containing protein [Nitrospira sp.]
MGRHAERWKTMKGNKMPFVILLLVALGPFPSWAFLTDDAVHLEPPAPSLPTAGSTATDPVFGSKILRVTDKLDGSECQIFYSNMPALNVNNTKVAAMCRLGYMRTKVWDFNAETMTISNGRLQSNEPTGAQGYFTQWSRITPNKFTICAQTKLIEVTIPDGSSTTWTNTTLHDFSTDFPGVSYVTQHSVSSDDDVFAVMSNTGGYAVWKRSTNSILLKVTNETNLNEVEIDKSGHYLVALQNDTTLHVWNLQAGPTETKVTVQPFNHRAMGNGIVGSGCETRRLCVRKLATPNSVTSLLPADSWSYATQQDHFSMPGDSDAWMIASRYSLTGGLARHTFDNEIVQIAMDGSSQVRRIAHHHSVIANNNYAAHPKASGNHDGSFIAFTSNWGQVDGRRDLYLVRVQPITATDLIPPTPPKTLGVR